MGIIFIPCPCYLFFLNLKYANSINIPSYIKYSGQLTILLLTLIVDIFLKNKIHT